MKNEFKRVEKEGIKILYCYYKENSENDLLRKSDYYSFFIPLANLPNLFLNDKMSFGRRGYVYPSLPNENHGIKGKLKGVEFYDILVDEKTLKKAKITAKVKYLPLDKPFKMSDTLSYLIHTFLITPDDSFIFSSLKDSIAQELVYLALHNNEEDYTFSNINDPRISEAVDYIISNYKSEIDIEYLAENAHCSKEHFIRLFKKETKETPISFLIRYRLFKAKELLETSDLSSDEVAKECGFKSANALSISFKKFYKLSIKDIKKSV